MELLIGQVVAKVDFQAKTIDSGTYMSKLEEFVKSIHLSNLDSSPARFIFPNNPFFCRKASFIILHQQSRKGL